MLGNKWLKVSLHGSPKFILKKKSNTVVNNASIDNIDDVGDPSASLRGSSVFYLEL